MGCGGSKSGPSFQDDVGPDGPLSAAPSQLLVTGHVQTEYNGIYMRALQPWNGKAMYSNGLRYLYYYNENEGGAPSWLSSETTATGSVADMTAPKARQSSQSQLNGSTS